MTNSQNNNNVQKDAWKTVAFVLAGLLAVSILVNSDVASEMVEAHLAQAVEPSELGQERTPRPDVFAAASIGPNDDPAIGSDSAGVELVAFLDFECHFCARFYNEVYPQIFESYVASGKVRFVTRDLVLRNHARGFAAAKAAGCVKKLSDDDRFFEYQAALYESGDLSDQALRLGARARGINEDLFDVCIEDQNGVVAAEIASDISAARVSGIRGTPTVFVNGRMIAGAQPYHVYQLAIEDALGR